MQLDVVSDTVCPWCYIGKKRLDQALALHGGEGITLRWRPFQLDASIPDGGVNRKAYMEKKFGSDPDRAKGVVKAIREYGDALGITFNFDRIEISPNTLDSHRLIRWAGTAGCQGEMVDILFRRYFTDAEDIGRRDVLIDAAAEAGMDTDIVNDLLEQGADRELIQREDAMARQMGIQGVPSFVINSKWVMVGAQETQALVRMFEKLLAKEAEDAAQ
ncbi:MAG TPA: DsbA family oxidoreductase [Parvibaculum sp.]|uniref:DsbA family oxidoreductase n=1 Tax=Parvibaculum sp. TaxID=2024848 RepID=UPI002BB0DDA6|nr:DsbA family oxidoreductase [Parvibaculum sp.]HMM14798.1 DsbA family oxidoreductase [Parvibaculum sp.]